MDQSMGDCPVCSKKLQSGDDIVICPECGAPYHRACYQQVGHCLFQEKHAAGFEYKTPQQQKVEAAAKDDGPAPSGLLCKNCNTVNDARNIFCEKCGVPLHAPGPQPGSQQAPPPGGVWPPRGAGPAVYGQTVYGPQMDYSGEIDGISKQDWAEYIGNAAPTYVTRLSQMSRRGTVFSFMPSVFFLGPFYFAYRKMWGWAALSFVITLAFSVLNIVWSLGESGALAMAASTVSTLGVLMDIASILSLVVNLLSGVFALQLYRLHARKRIKSLRQQYPDNAEYRTALARKGGISIPGVLVVIGALLAASIALSYIFGDAMAAMIYSYLSYM